MPKFKEHFSWVELSRGEKARKADGDPIRKNLKCHAKSFVGSKEVLEIFK